MDCAELTDTWTHLMAPDGGDVRTQLVTEAAEFLGIPLDEAWGRLNGARERFKAEWEREVANPADEAAVTRFYSRSETELFELIDWHASDPIHYRTLIVRDYARQAGGREFLDYGSGIGSDALVFGAAGYAVTIADISDVLLAFAQYRCRRHGIPARAIDLKASELPDEAFDVVLCLDVLEHIPRPLPVVRRIRQTLRRDGLLVIHAPFGEDVERPMHVVHRDIVTPRLRSLGFAPIDRPFPSCVYPPPRLYRKRQLPVFERAAYYAYDGYLNNRLGAYVARYYRTWRRPAAHQVEG